MLRSFQDDKAKTSGKWINGQHPDLLGGHTVHTWSFGSDAGTEATARRTCNLRVVSRSGFAVLSFWASNRARFTIGPSTLWNNPANSPERRRRRSRHRLKRFGEWGAGQS